MKKGPTVFLIIFSFLFLGLIPLKIFAYSAQTTHLKITELAVDFYNLYGSLKLNETEKQLIMKGSAEEDNGLRFVNHFYDPVFNKTWRFLGIQYLFQELTAKNWAKNPFAQAVYDPIYLASIGPIIKSPVFSETNFSWQRAIYEYVKGNRIKAFETLGHILHLIQDMSVPEHTRENAHFSFLDQAISYYENYTDRLDNSFYLPIKSQLKNFSDFIRKNNLDDYFDFLALYSNNYFLSPDTIPPSKYKLPQIEYQDVPEINEKGEIEYFLYGLDEKGEFLRLAKKNYLDWRMQSGFNNYTLNSEKVLKDYWQRLGVKSILTSAGVIDLFLKEAEKAKLDPNFVRKNERNLIASIFQGVNTFINDIFQKEPEVILVEKENKNLQDESFSNTPLNSTVSSTIQKEIPSTTKPLNIIKSTTTTKSTTSTTTTKLTTTTTRSTTTTTKTTATTKSTTTTQPVSICSFNTNKAPLRNSVIFNEISWMGTTQNSNAEWIELKNISQQTIDLSNWQILDKNEKIKIVFPLNTKISPNGLLLLERTNDESVPNVKADLIFVGAINNQNEGLRIFDNFCNLQDEVFANPDWPEGDNNTKRTMERRNNLSWQTSLEINGTPKRENSSGYLNFNSSSNNGSAITTTTTTSSSPPTAQLTTTTTTTNPPFYPKLLINEIKIAGKNTNGEIIVKDEFIEIYNPNDYPVDLTNWYIQKKTKSGNSYNSLVTKSVLENKTIQAKDYFVIGNILSPVTSNYDALWGDDYTLAEDNTIILKNPLGEVVDKVGWGEVLESEAQPTINPEPQKSIQRKKINNEPVDSDSNFDDFELLNCPTPKEREESCVLGETTQKENTDLNPFIKNFSWHYFDETKSKVVIEFDVDNYPFISNTTSTTNQFFGLAFYLNQEVPVVFNSLGEYDSYLGDRNSWEPDLDFSTLVLKYPDCQGYELLKRSLTFTTDDDFCHAPGMPWGITYRLDKLPIDNHFIIEVTGTSLDKNNHNFSENDYITIGFYGSVYPYYLRLIYPDNHKYYFEPNKFYHFPEKIENFTVSFSDTEIINSTNNSSSSLYFSFNKGKDEDLNDELTYIIQYVEKKEGDSLENNDLTRNPLNSWPNIPLNSTNLVYEENAQKFLASFPLASLSNLVLPVEQPKIVYLAIRAKDKIGLMSPLSDIREINIFPPPPPPATLSSFIQNINWYFDTDNKAYVEFDIIRNGKVPTNYTYFNYKIIAGLDYLPGSGFLVVNLSPTRIFVYPRRANRNYSSGDLRMAGMNEFIVFNQNEVPALTHYKTSAFNICLPEEGSLTWQCFSNDKGIIQNELNKRNKNLEDLYLFFAYGVCSHTNYGCVWFNIEDVENPPVFYLER